MNDKPLVSVVVATYNMAQYICEAVDSVLNQDYQNIEVILVDDGSEDDTQQKLQRYAGDQRVKIFWQHNAGQTAAKNRGLNEAVGEYIGFCDADNYWLPGKLSMQLDFCEENKKPTVIYGDLQLIDVLGKNLNTPIVKRYSGKITGPLLMDNFVTFNTTLIPRRILDEVGGFDETLRMGIDYDLWLRISVHYDFQYLPKPLVGYRIWGGQMSNRTGERFENFFRLMKNFLGKYPDSVSSVEIKRGWAHTYVSRGRWQVTERRYRAALQDYLTAFRLRPYDWRLWKSMLKFGLGR